MSAEYGIVIIGRNEGQRLVRCLESLKGEKRVYVDSGSTDNSVEQARRQGAAVVQLDMSLPFTAARARNAGAEKLLSENPQIEFIQFVDGDTQVDGEWLAAARRELQEHTSLAAVCGRRREIKPDASIYNLLCDIEWDTPVGDAAACGGDAMYRAAAFNAVGRFNEDFIAGEEPELCYRLRQAGWTIRRLDREMTRHDADMDRFRQWWKRSQRSGYAYALGALEHGTETESYKLRSCLSVLLWAGAVPLALLVLALFSPGAALVSLVAVYSYLGFKIYRRSRRAHPQFNRRQLAAYSAFLVLQKFPELAGMLQCGWQHMLGRKMSIIEYK